MNTIRKPPPRFSGGGILLETDVLVYSIIRGHFIETFRENKPCGFSLCNEDLKDFEKPAPGGWLLDYLNSYATPGIPYLSGKNVLFA